MKIHLFPLLKRGFMLILIIGFICPLHTQTVKKYGYSCVPGHPGKVIKWKNAYQKNPGPADKSITYWFAVELLNSMPNDEVSFIICAMLNTTQTKIRMPITLMEANENGTPGNKNDDTWECKPQLDAMGQPDSIDFHPNYHFGCNRITLNQANGFRDFRSIDKTVQMTSPFDRNQVGAPYVDIVLDHPIDPNCAGVTNKNNQFLIPGDGAFPSKSSFTSDVCPPVNPVPNCNTPNCGTSSYWIATRGMDAADRTFVIREAFAPGNWYTMAYPENNYEAILSGEITNLPGGALVEVIFPPTIGGATAYLIPGEEPIGNTLALDIPFSINSSLAEAEDEHIYLGVDATDTPHPELPDGEMVEFVGHVIATNETFFPNGDILFAPGDTMHGVNLKFIADYNFPSIASTAVEAGNDRVSILIKATDETTIPVAATLEYFINDGPAEILPVPYDSIAIIGDTILFRANLPFVDPGSELTYTVYLVDEVGNETVETFTNIIDRVEGNSLDENLQISVYPTLSNGKVNIDFTTTGSENIQVHIFNAYGQKVYHQNYILFYGRQSVNLDLPDFSSGVYFLKFTSAKYAGVLNQKIVIQR